MHSSLKCAWYGAELDRCEVLVVSQTPRVAAAPAYSLPPKVAKLFWDSYFKRRDELTLLTRRYKH
jgi:hypothetical protein